MSDTVLVGVLSLLGTLAGAAGGVLVANKLVNYRLEQLEKKVDQHHSLIDRMYCAEHKLDLLGEQVKAVGLRVDELRLHMDLEGEWE